MLNTNLISYEVVSSKSQLFQIIELQNENLKINLDDETKEEEGFVTLSHSISILEEMNNLFPHVVAIYDNQVVGYTLIMLPSMSQAIFELKPMFTKINEINYNGALLKDSAYFVMGQVCIQKAFRGRQVFSKMYDKLNEVMRSQFQFIVTEIDAKNKRSINAHKKVGFIQLKRYTDDQNIEWIIVLKEIT